MAIQDGSTVVTLLRKNKLLPGATPLTSPVIAAKGWLRRPRVRARAGSIVSRSFLRVCESLASKPRNFAPTLWTSPQKFLLELEQARTLCGASRLRWG